MIDAPASPQAAPGAKGTAAEVFRVFLKLGLTSFGGPVAHLGYYREELIVRRRWVDEATYADLVALCQFLPGPGSSQTGFALGLIRAGWAGGLAAWAAFTLPSALVLFAFALAGTHWLGAAGPPIIHGLKLVAAAVVAQAVWGMARSLCPDRTRAGIGLGALVVTSLTAGSAGQIAAIAGGALAGFWLCQGSAAAPPGHAHASPVSRRAGVVAFGLFALLLLGLPLARAATDSQALDLFEAFYRAGALVFGGGHVVLPLLEAETVQRGWIGRDTFLAGYGLAQAVPGPLFTFSAYLGAAMTPAPNGAAGAALALAAIFLPGLLLVVAGLPLWALLRRLPRAQAALQGSNAAVVGLLAAALYDPVWTSAVATRSDFALVAAGFLLLTLWRLPSWAAVVLIVAASLATGWQG